MSDKPENIHVITINVVYTKPVRVFCMLLLATQAQDILC